VRSRAAGEMCSAKELPYDALVLGPDYAPHGVVREGYGWGMAGGRWSRSPCPHLKPLDIPFVSYCTPSNPVPVTGLRAHRPFDESPDPGGGGISLRADAAYSPIHFLLQRLKPMRLVRTVAATFAGMMLVPAVAFAQANAAKAPERDSWYWGINGGAMMFTAGYDAEKTVTAPSVGGEWFIARQRFALRISVQQAFFEEQAAVFDPTTIGGARPVDVKDWRRYAIELFVMPAGDRFILPYAGGGVALNVLQSATPQGSYVSEESLEEINTTVNDFSSRASLIAAVGAQFNFGKSAFFVQAAAMPTRNFFLLNRSAYTAVLEGGIRYSFGSAIEKF
jgi:hypothetical protein